MAATLTPSQISIVKATVPALQDHGVEITSLFYKNMLDAHPELHNIFNDTSQATGAQPRALAGAVFAYAKYVDDLAKLKAVVERIAQKHASLNIREEHYPIVGKYLIEAIAIVLGDAVTPEVGEAWVAAYAVLADVFINREKQIYRAFENWQGWRRFKVQRKVAESSEITSFYLVPEDGVSLPSFLPGQYISIRLLIPELGYRQPRQYSLSDAAESGHYRISVKKEAGKQPGMPGRISNLLHNSYQEGDVVEVTHPAGDFFVDPQIPAEKPITLISAGVGITPMMSILNSNIAKGSKRPITWVHGAHSSEVHAFKHHIRQTCEKNPNVDAVVFLSALGEKDVEGVDYHFEGRINLEKLSHENRLFLQDAGAEYFVCGPFKFMADVRNFLVAKGVSDDKVHSEVFGVGDE